MATVWENMPLCEEDAAATDWTELGLQPHRKYSMIRVPQILVPKSMYWNKPHNQALQNQFEPGLGIESVWRSGANYH